MEIETVDITSLDERQLAALEMLMAKAFADEPKDLLHVEIQRASDPRLGRGLVATQDDQVVGAVLSRQPRARSVFVVYMAVDSALRRRGLARWLLDQLAGACGERMELFVNEGNVAAARLYRAGGLVPVAGSAPQGQRRWAGVWKPDQD
jgi:ribosomal protein S18 acetylase RimI-like enzyme